MIITNEPGFYKEGDYGIRIENILHVMHSKTHKDFYAFDNLTMMPYCRELIDPELLSARHLEEIREYYENIDSTIKPLL